MTQPTDYYLGIVSERQEGSGPATVSTGHGDRGGASYGTYQLSSSAGTLHEYLTQSAYGHQFAGLVPATPEFDKRWRDLARDDPGFAKDQHAFIRTSHYDVQVRRLKDVGIDLTNRGPAVQEALFSTSVQFGNGTRKIFREGLAEAYGRDYKLSNLTDKDIVVAVQDFKLAHNNQLFRGSQANWPGLLRRARAEKAELIAMADGQPLHDRPQDVPCVSVALKQGSRGDEVTRLQRKLDELGYAVAVDGKFGPDTQAAVKSFQEAHGLEADGVVRSTTSVAVARAFEQVVGAGRPTERPLGLDHPSHPDHAFYRQTHALVCELDRQHGRTPDPLSSNLASALVVSARQAGMARIDRLALDDHGAVVWGMQSLPGTPLAEKCCRVDALQALNTPAEHSAARWPGAMQAYGQQQEILARAQVPAPSAHAVMAAHER